MVFCKYDNYIGLFVLLSLYIAEYCVAGASYHNLLDKLNNHIDDNLNEDITCVPDCKSKIYCQGELLHDIQMARIYDDSKTFVDKQLLYSEEEILAKYERLKNTTRVPSQQQLKNFIDENFQNEELIQYDPPDFKKNPSIVNHVADKNYRTFVLQLNEIWKELCRQVSDDVQKSPDRYSSIYLPNPFIIAGNRFREMYYWDSYWIIRGLLLCDMYDTARGIIENMIWLVKEYGHILNGSRIYYAQRSQPPLLIQMAATYHSCTKDDVFIKNNLQYFDIEFQWWFTNRMITVHKDGKEHRLARYNAPSCSPRPESYYEDFTLAQNVSTNEEKFKLYTNIKSAAESGWDFSNRHVINKDGTNSGSMLYLNTPNIVFVDLNCMLHANAIVLSEWYKHFGNEQRSLYYRSIANKLLDAIDAVFWNDDIGAWLDWDLINNKSRHYFYPSNLTPLWTGSYYKKKNHVDKVLKYLLVQGIIKYDGSPVYWGVPTSLYNTSQQWDFPNCWSPLQAFVIQGLERSNHPIARYVAYKMAQNWIKTLYAGFTEYGFMYEKYDAVMLGETGNGGEYTPQTGFGWTNGFCLEIFNTWGMFLRSNYIPIITPLTSLMGSILNNRQQ